MKPKSLIDDFTILKAMAPSEGPYESVLGPSFHELPAHVQAAHRTGLRATGTMLVENGSNVAARLLARWMRLPRSGQAAVHLQVSRAPTGQFWKRTFNGQSMLTLQHAMGGNIVERSGVFSISMKVWIEKGAVHYETVSASFLGLPVPRAFAPSASAVVEDRPNGWYVDVTIASTALGLLCRYHGEMRQE